MKRSLFGATALVALLAGGVLHRVAQSQDAMTPAPQPAAPPAEGQTSEPSAPASGAETVTVSQVQGEGEETPLLKQTVTVEGVVTGDFSGADKLRGFFLMGADDNNPRTSDGVFVYLGTRGRLADTRVQVGQRVRVTGRADEYKGQTQIAARSIEDLGARRPDFEDLPTPVAVDLPLGAENRESLEGMLVTIPETLTVSDNYELGRFGTLALSSDGRTFNPTNGQGGSREENQRRRLLLDDGSDKRNPAQVPYLNAEGTRRLGSTVTGLTGIFSFGHKDYRLQPTVSPTFVDANPRPAKPPALGGSYRIASLNLHNYWTTFKESDRQARGAQNAEAFERQAKKSVLALRALNGDAVALMELENNGDAAMDDLVKRLNASYGRKVYAKVPAPSTGFGSDRIRLGMIYKPARLTLVGASQSATDAIFERRPIAQTFKPKTSAAFTLVANHWKSKGSCPKDPNDVNADKGQGCWNPKRVTQAQAVAKFVERLVAQTPAVIVIGDLNSYGEEDPLRELGKTMAQLKPKAETGAYSFTFQGQSGSLDHAFVTTDALRRATRVVEWHINADEPELHDYASPSRASVPLAQETFYRSSDHDPLLLGLR